MGNAAIMRTFLKRAAAVGEWAKTINIIFAKGGAADTTPRMICDVLLIRIGKCVYGAERVLATPE